MEILEHILLAIAGGLVASLPIWLTLIVLKIEQAISVRRGNCKWPYNIKERRY